MVSRLKKIIDEALRDSLKHEQRLVQVCANIAGAYLKTKVNKHGELLQFLSPSLKDVAIDSIAELFVKKDHELVVFKKWINRIDYRSLNESEVFIELRKMVFTEVNDHLFKVYKEKDPTLSKIIRNLKRVIKNGEVEGLIFLPGQRCITLTYLEAPFEEMVPEVLEACLLPKIRAAHNTLMILQALREILEVEQTISRKVHVTALGLVIRRIFVHYNEEYKEFSLNGYFFEEEESKTFIRETVRDIQVDMYHSYVLKGKMDAEELARYFYVVEQVLTSDYTESELSGISFYEHYRRVVPETGQQEYRQNNRKILEYLVKKTRNEFISRCRREINSANNI